MLGSIDIDDDDKRITLIVDAYVLTITKKGDYIEQNGSGRKEFINLHIAVDTRSRKIISFRVAKGNVHDSKEFSSMIREVSEQYGIDKVYADKGS